MFFLLNYELIQGSMPVYRHEEDGSLFLAHLDGPNLWEYWEQNILKNVGGERVLWNAESIVVFYMFIL